MVPGPMGHLYPLIDRSSCIDCALCRRICPSEGSVRLLKPSAAYAAWLKDPADYKYSTSGGMAAALSRLIVSEGGVVYGCAILPDIDVRHIRVDSPADLYKLKGSKYVQSDLRPIWKSLQEDVKSGRKVLFTGTPCQVAAVRNLFKTQPSNLYCVDLICHGVPSLESLRAHVRKVADCEHYEKVVFREGDGIYVVVVGIIDGAAKEVYRTSLSEQRYEDWYINTFIDGFTYRDSCYKCAYARPERAGDITIGDFWGLGAQQSAEEIPPHENGCSVALVSTAKGRELFDAVRETLNVYERPVEEAVAGNDQLRAPKKMNLLISLYRAINKHMKAPWLYFVLTKINNKWVRLKKSVF